MSLTFTVVRSAQSLSFTVQPGVGPAGPNEISGGTTTALTGLLKGAGGIVAAATENADFQGVPGAKTADFTAENNGSYVADGTVIVTDPSTPVANKGFEVLVQGGSVTIGGVAYTIEGMLVKRVYDGAAWQTFKFVDVAIARTFSASEKEQFWVNGGLTAYDDVSQANDNLTPGNVYYDRALGRPHVNTA